MLASSAPEALHPSLWRASQLAQARGPVVETGYPALSAELPGGGWPVGALIDLLGEPGCGELRLLRPALGALGRRPVALVQPPYLPNAPGLAYLGVPLERVLWLRPAKAPDALWAAEQILRAGTCGALLVWLQHVQTAALRRLHLAAQSTETLLFALRPLQAAQDASPAALRLALRSAADGLSVEIVKRRGPPAAAPVPVPLHPSPVLLSRHARLSRRSRLPLSARHPAPPVAA